MTRAKLAQLLRDAAEAHHKFETARNTTDEKWPEWYAGYMLPAIIADTPSVCMSKSLDLVTEERHGDNVV